VVAVLAAIAVGCSGVANLNIPTPPPTAPGALTPTTPATNNLTGVNLETVPPGVTTTVVLVPGAASLSGVVTGPTGPVPGATVLLERLVGDAVGSRTVPSQPDGTWKVTGILGGRYRIRAWHAPDLSMTTPAVVLLGAKDTQNVPLTLMSFSGQTVTATVSPSPPLVGQVATLVVTAAQQAVGPDGVVRGAPLPGHSLLVFAAGTVVLAGTNPGTTDAGGRLVLSLGCSQSGPVGLTATLDNANSFTLAVPDCIDFVPPATTATTSPASTTVKPTTSSVP
jgi:hypothetical protein